MSTITALFGMVAILVIGSVAVIAIQEWGKVQMARARHDIIKMATKKAEPAKPIDGTCEPRWEGVQSDKTV